MPIQKLVGLAQKFGPAQNILEPVEGQGIKFFKKICWSLVIEKNAEGREFANFLRSLEQCFQTVKDQNNFW